MVNEFRRIDGKLFHPQLLELAGTSMLPLHSCDGIQVDRRLIASPALWDRIVTMEGSVWCAADGPSDEKDSSLIEHIIATIDDALHEPLTVMNGLGPNIGTYSFVTKDVQPIYTDETSAVPSFWMADYTLTLTKQIGG